MSKLDDLFLDLSKSNNLKLLALYTYDLKKKPKSKAVRFVYVLKGRNKDQGIIKEFKGKFLAPGCFIIPINKDKEVQEIFSFWDIPFKRKLMLTD